MTAILDDCSDTLEITHKTMKKYVDRDRAELPNIFQR
jgi:hypothetical protein